MGPGREGRDWAPAGAPPAPGAASALPKGELGPAGRSVVERPLAAVASTPGAGRGVVPLAGAALALAAALLAVRDAVDLLAAALPRAVGVAALAAAFLAGVAVLVAALLAGVALPLTGALSGRDAAGFLRPRAERTRSRLVSRASSTDSASANSRRRTRLKRLRTSRSTRRTSATMRSPDSG